MGDGLRQRIRQEHFESASQEAYLNLLVAAGHLRAQFERVCTEHGITNSQYNVLRILRGVHPQGHSRCEIAQRMIERAPDVTRLIDRLEKRGLVERDRSDQDRRLSISRITARGLQLLVEIAPTAERLHQEFRERLSEEDSLVLSRICEQIYRET
jgi:DNA-binding MarR family transcriptional regulator